MGFGQKTPKPPPTERVLSARNNLHQHTYYDARGNRQRSSCRCDTGADHTTPWEAPAQPVADDKES